MPDLGTEVKTGSEAGTYAEEEVGVAGVDACAVAEGDVAVAGGGRPRSRSGGRGVRIDGQLAATVSTEGLPFLGLSSAIQTKHRRSFHETSAQTCSSPS